MQALGIVGTVVLAAIGYGIVHDQITARVCVEYFTVGHVRVIASDDPTLLGLVWGVIATWWTGLLLGIPLAIAARIGARPKRSLRSLLKPILILLAVMGVFATVAGFVGYLLGTSGTLVIPVDLKEELPPQKWATFQACAFAHTMSYNTAFVGGGLLIAWTWVTRHPRSARRVSADKSASNPTVPTK